MSDRVPFHRTVFDHIPKTAGTSIRTAMGEALGESAQRRERSCPHYLAIRTPGRRLIASHLWFYPGEPLAHDWFYATTSANPSIGSCRSSISIEIVCGRDDPHVAAAARRPGILHLVRSRTRRSTGQCAVHPLRRAHVREPEWLKAADYGCRGPSLEEYDLVGTFMMFRASPIATATRWMCRQRVPHLNVTSRPSQQDTHEPRSHQQAHVRNTVDAALYEWATQRCSRPDRRACAHELPLGRAEFGNRKIEILSVVCRGRDAEEAVIQAETTSLSFGVPGAPEEHDLTVGIAIRNEQNEQVFGTNSQVQGRSLSVAVEQSFVVSLTLRLDLPAGRHGITLALHKGRTHHEGCITGVRTQRHSRAASRCFHASQDVIHIRARTRHEHRVDCARPRGRV